MGSLDNGLIVTNRITVEKVPESPDKFLRNLKSYCGEYYDYTGIHGFKYFGERRSLFEKILWIIIFISSMVVCIAVIYQTYRKWQSSPVIVNFDSGETNIYEIPFPAVTICHEVKSTRKNFNYSDIMKKLIVEKQELTPLELKNLQYMSMLCGEGKRFSKNIPNISTIDEDFYTFLERGSVSFLHNCSWMGNPYDCRKIFRPIITDEGLCMTFNMLDDDLVYRNVYIPNVNRNLNHEFSHWTVDGGYNENAGVNTYPRRALLAGSSNALIVNMEVEKADIDYACTSFQGYQVVLHKAIRFPTVQQHYFRVPLGKSVIVAISPSQIVTSDDVKYYSPAKRECYLQGERELKYFQNYTQFNCKLECLTNHTLNVCGCVAFYMPRERGIAICGNGNKECMKNVKNHLDMSGLRHSIDGYSNIRNLKGVIHCDCLPMCTVVEYNTEITEIDFDLYKEIESVGLNTDKDERLASSQLVLYFKADHFIPYIRNELYGHLDFLANVGGLLGLFVGFSIVSLIEIIYFLSVRIICNMKLYKHWYGEDVDDDK